MSTSSYKSPIPIVQRALVLQGGEALGAYQAGAFNHTIKKLKEIKMTTTMMIHCVILLPGLLRCYKRCNSC